MISSFIRRMLAASFVAFITVTLSLPALADVQYTYDEIGRLVGVYAPSGDAAQYVYDPAGNITAIKRFTASQLAIIEFTPNSGPIGSTITIWGTGFSATPGNNAVTFNGTAATVATASVSKLTVVVPTGAATGPIGITVAAASTTSATNFTVAASGGAPTITSFSPAAGAAGASITITGTNFDATASGNFVNLNLTSAAVSSATSTSISTTVPVNAGSGKLKARTINGTAVSATDFLVPFGTYIAADLVTSARTTVNGTAASYSIGTANKVGMVLFEGVQGQNVGIGVTSNGSGVVTVLTPENIAMPISPDSTATATSFVNGGWSVDPMTLPLTGTYAVAIAAGAGGGISGTVTVSTEVTASLGSPGTITSTATTRNGQNGRYTFAGTAAQAVTIYVSGMTAGMRPFSIRVFDPFGWLVASSNTGSTATPTTMLQTVLAATGPHTVMISGDPAGFGAFSIQYGMPDLTVTALSTGSIFANQNGSYSIPVTATVANQGTVAFTPAGKDSAFLSTDATLDTTDKFLGTATNLFDVPSGSTYGVSFNGTAPIGTTPGTYNLIFKADAADNAVTYATSPEKLKESDETNNTRMVSITIPTLPDLTVSGLSVGTVTGNQNGSFNMPVTFTVNNAGGSLAKAQWNDQCFLSSDATLGTGDTIVGFLTNFSDLAAAGSYGVSITCVAPASTSPGSYTLFAKADANDFSGSYTGTQKVTESNESNNTASVSVTVPAPADLAISSPSVGTISVNGNGSYNIPVSFIVTNVGTGVAARASWNDACYLSSDATLDTSDNNIGSLQHSTDLAASAQYTVNLTCVTPTTTTAGNYTVFLKADGRFAVGKYSALEFLVEPNKANNVTSAAVTLPTKP